MIYILYNINIWVYDERFCLVVNYTSPQIGQFVTGCLGRGTDHRSRGLQTRNNAHILVTQLPITHF